MSRDSLGPFISALLRCRRSSGGIDLSTICSAARSARSEAIWAFRLLADYAQRACEHLFENSTNGLRREGGSSCCLHQSRLASIGPESLACGPAPRKSEPFCPVPYSATSELARGRQCHRKSFISVRSNPSEMRPVRRGARRTQTIALPYP